jgi:hypothetical protein
MLLNEFSPIYVADDGGREALTPKSLRPVINPQAGRY